MWSRLFDKGAPGRKVQFTRRRFRFEIRRKVSHLELTSAKYHSRVLHQDELNVKSSSLRIERVKHQTCYSAGLRTKLQRGCTNGSNCDQLGHSPRTSGLEMLTRKMRMSQATNSFKSRLITAVYISIYFGAQLISAGLTGAT